MSRDQEDRLLTSLADLRAQRAQLVSRIAMARRNGKRDAKAIAQLEKLSDRQIELTGFEPRHVGVGT